MNGGAELVYVADPMCSWCYGFGPQLERFLAKHPLPVRLVLGGLYVGPMAPALDDGLRRYLSETWSRVEAMSGQPFSLELLDRSGWIYDTELACRAAVAMRRLAPGHELAFFTRLQRAFYLDAVDLTDGDAYPALLADRPVEVGGFMAELSSGATRRETADDFAAAVSMGFGGFPALVFGGYEGIPLAVGYKSEAQISRTFHVVAADVAAEVCTDPESCRPS